MFKIIFWVRRCRGAPFPAGLYSVRAAQTTAWGDGCLILRIIARKPAGNPRASHWSAANDHQAQRFPGPGRRPARRFHGFGSCRQCGARPSGHKGSETGNGARLQRALSGRAPRSGRLSHGRHRRGHDLPGRHRRALARLAAQPAGGVQRAVRLRGHLRQRSAAASRACSKDRCRAGSSSGRPARRSARPAPPTACRALPMPRSRRDFRSARSR